MIPGQTSEIPIHAVALVERHEISASIPPGCPTGAIESIVRGCAQRAAAWAESTGVALGRVEPFHTDGLTVGVRFEVTVGSGSLDQESAWAWSARWLRWYGVLREVMRPTRDREPDSAGGELADVIPLFGCPRDSNGHMIPHNCGADG